MTGFVDRDHCLVAILRGCRPDEVESVVTKLIEKGFRAIEIPLNSPDPFTSIANAVRAAEAAAPGECLIGAGTVLTVDQVRSVYEAGGRLVVSPNCDVSVIRAAVDAGIKSLPGVLTPTEAFQALQAGADGLKLFPASVLGANGIKALRAVLPADTRIYAVGGVSSSSLAEYLAAGVYGFGFGTNLYRQGLNVSDVASNASSLIAAYKQALGK